MAAFNININADDPSYKRRLADMHPEAEGTESADYMDIHWPTARRSVGQALRRVADLLEKGEYVGGFCVEDDNGLKVMGDVDER